MKTTKKFLAMLLCIIMCLSLFPVSAFADGEPEEFEDGSEPQYTDVLDEASSEAEELDLPETTEPPLEAGNPDDPDGTEEPVEDNIIPEPENGEPEAEEVETQSQDEPEDDPEIATQADSTLEEFSTFEELANLCSRSYTDSFTAWFTHEQGSQITIERNLTIPKNLDVYMLAYEDKDSTVVVPQGVTLTIDGSIGVDNLVVNGTVKCRGSGNMTPLTVNKSLTGSGKIYNERTISLYFQAWSPAVLDRVIPQGSNYPSLTVFVKDGFVIDSSFSVPKGMLLSFYADPPVENEPDENEPVQYETVEGTIAPGVTVSIGSGNTLYITNLVLNVEGSLVNNGQFMVALAPPTYNAMLKVSNGSYSGTGDLGFVVHNGFFFNPDAYFEGINLSRFDRHDIRPGNYYIYTPKISTITYTLSFDANGGMGAPASQKAREGTAVTLPSTEPTRSGYTFLGWASDPGATAPNWQAGDSYALNANAALYAVWAQGVRIDELHFPDAAFREYVIDTFDLDDNGVLSDEEATRVRVIECESSGIQSLEGIGYFPNLIGISCPYNQITKLDLSKNPNLTWVSCGNNRIDSIDLSNTPLLESLYCKGNPLTSLDLSNCPKLLVENDYFITDDDVDLQVSSGKAPTLDKDYILLTDGKSATVTVDNYSAEWSDLISWVVESDSTGLISVTKNGTSATITAGSGTGTAYVLASIPVLNTETVRCRVDVAPDRNVLDVQLKDTKATTELFRTDYTELQIIPVIEQNEIFAQDVNGDGGTRDSLPVPGIQSAEFCDPAANVAFELRVVDDRTVAVVPKESAIEDPSAVRGKYVSKIRVTIRGIDADANNTDTYETAPLTLTVKKSTPKIKADAVKFNSFIPGDSVPLNISVTNGGSIKSIEVPTVVNGKPVTVPDFVDISEISRGVLKLKNGAAKSGKLWLQCELEGWEEFPAVFQISVSKAETKPTLTVKPATLTLTPNSDDMANALVTITPAVFDDPVKYPVSVTKITEGSGKNLITYEGDNLNKVLETEYYTTRSFRYTFNWLTAKLVPDSGLDFSKAHTFKVYLSIAVGDNTVTKVVTVNTRKTIEDKPQVVITAKATGAIDTKVPMSPILLSGSWKNYSFVPLDWDVKYTPNKALPDNITVDDLFDKAHKFSSHDFSITANPDKNDVLAELIAQGYSFTAELSADIGAAERVSSKPVKLNIKTSKTAPKVSAALKTAGSIDVIRPGSYITLTPEIKNWYSSGTRDFKFYRLVGKEYVQVDGLFQVDDVDDGEKFAISVSSGKTVNHKDKYFVRLKTDIVTDAQPDGVMSPYTPLKVAMGTVKLTNGTMNANFLANDCNSSVVIRPASADDSLGPVWDIRFADSGTYVSKDDRFQITQQIDGSWLLSYKDNKIPANRKAATLKLNVYYAGNYLRPNNPDFTGKPVPNTALSVKINIIGAPVLLP